nr:BA14K family protein [Mesorhizobium kowhaii]
MNQAAQAYERVPAQQHAAEPDPATTASTDSTLPDGMPTGAIQQEQQANLPAAHIDWCWERYRSYRPEDNSYLSYSGQRRSCISPYLDLGAANLRPTTASVSYVDSSADTDTGYSTDHQEYCFSRYRSYRAEDNTYQPFSGGPRRPCE